jgi:hypothetical protein
MSAFSFEKKVFVLLKYFFEKIFFFFAFSKFFKEKIIKNKEK